MFCGFGTRVDAICFSPDPRRDDRPVARGVGTERNNALKRRCEWSGSDPLYLDYHDIEWGVPLHEDHRLFEMLLLEGVQAGLSWITVLRKRDAYRQAFDRFDPETISRYDEARIRALLQNPGIIRNRLKIQASVVNAQAFLGVVKEFGSFDRYIWRFVENRPIQNHWTCLQDIPSRTPESDAMSKDLKEKGFKFVGSTICYAFMQAVGMVNDHPTYCFRHKEVKRYNPTLPSPPNPGERGG